MQNRKPPGTASRIAYAVMASASLVVIVIALTAHFRVSSQYAYWVFCGLPFIQGLASSIVLEIFGPARFAKHALANLLALLLLALLLLVFAIEGAVCVAMVAPLALVGSLAGSGLAISLMILIHGRKGPAIVSLFVVVPVFLVTDSLTAGKPDIRTLSTEIVISAPPEQIWPLLSNLDSIHSDYWLFEAGVAHAVSVRTLQPALGGRRECVLSTGVMKETITEWSPGRRLSFAIHNTPPSMRELNPFGEVHAPHLQGYYESLEGSFTLVSLQNGKTKLVGFSRFQHKFRPVSYWGWWTDRIVREIQLSVLKEIKTRAEKLD